MPDMEIILDGYAIHSRLMTDFGCAKVGSLSSRDTLRVLLEDCGSG